MSLDVVVKPGSSDPRYCPMCTEPLQTVTRRLPCLHVVCAACPKPTAAPDAKFQCMWLTDGVYCGEGFSRGDVMVDATEESFEGAAKCAHCGQVATQHCDTCYRDMCDIEAVAHFTALASKDHRMVAQGMSSSGDDGSSGNASRRLVCKQHPTRAVIQFCTRCSEFVCVDCVNPSSHRHEAHDMVSVNAGLRMRQVVAKQLVEDMQPIYNTIVNGIQTVDKSIDDSLRLKKLNGAQCATAMDPIIAEYERLLQQAKQRKADLLALIDQDSDQATKTLRDQRDKLVVAREHIDAAQALVPTLDPERYPSESSECAETTATREATIARLLTLRDRDIETAPVVGQAIYLTFTAPMATLSLSRMEVASFGTPETCPLNNIERFVPPIINVPLRDFSAITESRFDVIGSDGSGPNNLSYPRGLGWTPHGFLLVADCNNWRIKMMTPGGDYLQSISVGRKVHSVAVSKYQLAPATPTEEPSEVSDCVWVSSLLDHKVACFDLHTHEKLAELGDCTNAYGVAIGPNGVVIVGCGDSNNVRCCSPNGTILWVSEGDPACKLQVVLGVAIVPAQNVVLACDLKNERIQVLSLTSGAFVRHIGGPTALKGPCSVFYDSASGYIFVGELSRVSVWTLQGDMIRRWMTANSNSSHSAQPVFGITVRPAGGEIYVSNTHSHQLLVY